MKKEFNELVDTLKRWDLFQQGDEVDMALTDLENKIDEVEKRIECAVRSAKEINETISKYTEEIDDGSPIKMSVSDHDVIQNCSDDVRIALDLNDDMSVIDNWYNLFSPIASENKFHVENEETYPIVNCLNCGHPQPLLEENVHVDSMGRHMVCESCESSFNIEPIKQEVFVSFESSWGTLTCDKHGNVIEVIGDEEYNGERNYLFDIAKIDLVEYENFLNSIGQELEHDEDMLSVGFWKKDGKYEEADHDWRKRMFIVESNEPPTVLCQTPQINEFVKDIISKLKFIEVDGETMEYILRQVGMQDQMLKQLFAQSTNDEIDYLHDVRNGKG